MAMGAGNLLCTYLVPLAMRLSTFDVDVTCDKCSQAFPFFAILPHLHIWYSYKPLKEKKEGRPGNKDMLFTFTTSNFDWIFCV